MLLRRDGGWSVRAQLLGSVATVMALLVAAGAVVGAHTIGQARERAEREASFQAGLAADAISDALGQGQAAMAGLAAGLDVAAVAAVVAAPANCRLASDRDGVFPTTHIDIVLPDGRVPCSSLTSKGAPAGASQAGAPWLAQALAGGGRGPAVSAPFTDRLSGRRAIAVTTVIPGRSGRAAGVAAFVAALDDLDDGLAATYGGPGRLRFTVSDAGGSLLTGSDGDRAGAAGRVGGRRAVKGLGWRVDASMTAAAATGPTRSTLAGQALLVLAAAALMALLIGLVNRRIARPLGALTEAADRAARREPARAALVEAGPAEVRRLAASFDAMVAARDGHEAELATAYAEMERHAADLELFVYAASHDLAEPLRTVTSWAQLLERDHGQRLGADAAQALGFVIEGTNRMHDLVAGIMAHARAARGQLERSTVDLGELVDEATRALKAAVEAAGATIEVDGELPVVAGDRDQLAQLVQNLLANAVKFHRPGQRPQVRVSAGHHQDAGRWWLSVADDGIGIDPPHRERVFHMFQRLNPRGDYPGSGVGLAVCERIVQRHGGRIWVDDAPGGGAVFTLEIPDRA